MQAELRAESQVTIPKELVDRLGLSEGDMLDVYEEDGVICFSPVEAYAKEYLEELREEIEETKIRVSSGKQPVYDNLDALFAVLDNS